MTDRPTARLGPDPGKLRLLRRLPDGTVRCGGLELLEGEGLLWLDLQDQGEPELAFLASHFRFHPLAIEDLRHLDQRPKLEDYGDYLFLVQHAFAPVAKTPLPLRELHAFLSRDYLVTVHAPPMPEVDDIYGRACADPSLAARGPDFLFYLLSDAVADGHLQVLDDLADSIESLEDEILAEPRRESIQRILGLKRALVQMRRAVSPARDVFGQLSRCGDPRISERTAPYFRDVYDHLLRVGDAIEADRDMLGNALEAYMSMTAGRTNETVKQLTLFSVTFLPLTFLAGVFGQNFTNIPFDSAALFYLALAAYGALPVAMLLWFRWKGWL